MDTQIEIPKPRKDGRGYSKNIPIERIFELKNKDLTDEQIAHLLGCERSNITKRLAKYKDQIEGVERFKKHRADVLTFQQMRVLDAITDAKLKSAPLNVLGPAFGIFYDKERLERGQSTENISIKSITQSLSRDVEDINKRKLALLAQLEE